MADPDELEQTCGATATEIADRLREAIMAGNAAAAEQWSSALDSATSAWATARAEQDG